MAAIDRLIRQLKDQIKEAESKGDYLEVSRLEGKLVDAEEKKEFWY